MVTRTLTNTGNPLVNGLGQPLANVKINFTLVDAKELPTSGWDVFSEERITPGPITVKTDSNGIFSVNLWPNSRGDKVTFWKCRTDVAGVQDFKGSISEGTTALQWIDFRYPARQSMRYSVLTSAHPSLNAAITSIGGTNAHLILDGPASMTSNLTIPVNVKFEVSPRGEIDQGTNTLTINGLFVAERHRIFTGTGQVSFGKGSIREAYPEWWSDTGGIREAVIAAGGTAKIKLARGKAYYATATIPCLEATRMVEIEGEACSRLAQNGSQIYFDFTGALFEMGTDDGLNWANSPNMYKGVQGFRLKNVAIAYIGTQDLTDPAHPAANPTLLCGGGTYGNNTCAIRDWRGGDVELENVFIERCHYGFFGINSDINRFNNVQLFYCKVGMYFGPRSDQFHVANPYTWACDHAILIDGTHGRIENPQIVACGHTADDGTTHYPIEILRGAYTSKNVVIENPWFERYTAYDRRGLNAFIGIGVNSGYNNGQTAPHVYISNPVMLTMPQGTIGTVDTSGGQPGPQGYAKHLVEIGKANVRLNEFDGDIASIVSIANFVGSWVNTEALFTLRATNNYYLNGISTPSKVFKNTTGVAKDVYVELIGQGGTLFYGATNRLFCKQLPAAADPADPVVTSAIDKMRDFSLYPYNARIAALAFDNVDNNYLQLGRRFHTGAITWIDGSAADSPAYGSWDKGDIVLYNQYSGVGIPGYIGKFCVQGGTTGTYSEGVDALNNPYPLLTATGDGTNVVVLSAGTRTLKVGMYLTINGTDGMISKIETNDDGKTVLTLLQQNGGSAANVATGSGYGLTFRKPKWRKFGAVDLSVGGDTY